jgi:hypothetical protein
MRRRFDPRKQPAAETAGLDSAKLEAQALNLRGRAESVETWVITR